MTPFKTIAATLLVCAAIAAPAFAEDAAVDAATQEKLTAQLAADGYEVRKIQTEDGKIEVYAVKDGKTYEMYFDSDLKLIETK